MNTKIEDSFYGMASRHLHSIVSTSPGFCNVFQLDEKVLASAPLLHHDADYFFRTILKTPPPLGNLNLRKDNLPYRFPLRLHGDDIRQLLTTINDQGASIFLQCNKDDQSPFRTPLWVLNISRRYTVHSFPRLLGFLEAFGLPEPSVICTCGDNWLRYTYILKGLDLGDRWLEFTQIQHQLEVLLAGADIRPAASSELLVPGFKFHDKFLSGSPRVRMVGGSKKSLDVDYFSSELSNLCDLLWHSVEAREAVIHVKDHIASEQVHEIAKELIAKHDLSLPFQQYHFVVSYQQALSQSSGPCVDQTELYEQFYPPVDANIWSDHDLILSQYVNSNYFWYVADQHSIAPLEEYLAPISIERSLSIEEIEPCIYDEDYMYSDQPLSLSPSPSAVDALVQQGKSDAESIRLFARQICLDQNINPVDLSQFLKAYSKSLKTKFDNTYIDNILREALLSAKGVGDPLTPCDVLKIEPTPWLWDSLLIKGALNLVVAQPKTGKTSLMLAFLAALLRPDESFLGKLIYGGPYKVVIIGTDQPTTDWIRMLREVDLITLDSRLHPSILALYTASHCLYFDEKGLEQIERHARDGTQVIYLFDSLAACTAPLGYDENSQAIAVPICQLMGRLAPYGSTSILVHHSGKSVTADSPTAVSRGSSAIPATASQIISLRREAFNQSQSEAGTDRITLETQGRAGQPIKIVIQRMKDGWINLGDEKRITKSLQRESLIADLNDRQRAVLELVEKRWQVSEYTTSSQALEALSILFEGCNRDRSVRAVFDQLRVKRLLESIPGAPLKWKPK